MIKIKSKHKKIGVIPDLNRNLNLIIVRKVAKAKTLKSEIQQQPQSSEANRKFDMDLADLRRLERFNPYLTIGI